MYRNFLTTSHYGRFNYELLTSKTLPEALNILKKSFFKDEVISKITGVCKNENAMNELLKMPEYMAKQGASYVAIDNLTGKVAGVQFNKIIVKSLHENDNFYENAVKNAKETSTINTYKFLMHVDSLCDVFEHYNVDSVMEMGLAGVQDEYRNKGLCFKLCEVAVEFCKKLAANKTIQLEDKNIYPAPNLITALPTGSYSKKVTIKLGFENFKDINLYKYFNGKRFDGTEIDKNTVASLMCLKI